MIVAREGDRHRGAREPYPPEEHPDEQELIEEIVEESGDRSRGGASSSSALGAAGGALGLAALTPALSFGPLLAREALLRDAVAQGPPARRRAEPAAARRRHRGEVVLHRVPRGRRQGGARLRRSSSCGCRRTRCGCRRARGLRRRRHRRVLEDLHARRLRDLDVPRAALPAGRAAPGARLPVPLLDVRSRRRRQRARSARRAGRCRCCRCGRRAGLPAREGQLQRRRRPVVVGRPQPEADARDPPRSSASSTSAAAPRRSCARRCATSSPTTGRSCSARSRSTRSSCSSRRAST